MGYNVDLLLERAEQRAAFDEAVEAGGYDLASGDAGNRSSDDYEGQSLWDGHSDYRDLFEALRWYGSPVQAGEASPADGEEVTRAWECEASYWLKPRILTALGQVARSVYASPLGEAVRMAETLSYASEIMVGDFWSGTMRPRASVRTYRFEMPLPDRVTIGVPSVKVEHDVDLPLWLPDFGPAREAVLDVRVAETELAQAERRLAEARGKDEDTFAARTAFAMAERRVDQARERAKGVRGSTQPVTDRVSLGNVSAELDTRTHEVEVCVEERDPHEEYRRAYELAHAVLAPLRQAGLKGLVASVRAFIDCYIAIACPTLEELGTIGRVCQAADIQRLQVCPSW